jgi:hypothetical protein
MRLACASLKLMGPGPPFCATACSTLPKIDFKWFNVVLAYLWALYNDTMSTEVPCVLNQPSGIRVAAAGTMPAGRGRAAAQAGPGEQRVKRKLAVLTDPWRTHVLFLWVSGLGCGARHAQPHAALLSPAACRH